MMSGNDPHKIYEGGDGVTVALFDETSTYGYSNIFHVKVRVEARFDDTAEMFDRVLERMGVHESVVAETLTELVTEFECTTLPYLFRQGFGSELARRKQNTRETRIRTYVGAR